MEAKIDGHRIHYEVEGTGPTILLIHGFPTSGEDWGPLVAQLATSFRCVRLDLLGLGRSDKPRLKYSFDLQLAAVRGIARELGLARAVLIAHDYGSSVAQLLLAQQQRGELSFEVPGAILMNAGLEPALHRPRLVQRLLASPIGAWLGPLVTTRRTFERTMREIIVKTEPIPFQAMWGGIEANGGRAVIPSILGYMAERRARRAELLGSITRSKVPLGFVWGLADPISGGHMLDWIRGAVPNAEILALDGIGHYPQLEATDACAAWILDWARRHALSGLNPPAPARA